MASFETDGLDGLMLSMEELARIPKKTIEEMLLRGAAVVKNAHMKAISSSFVSRTGKLAGSPKVFLRSRGKQYALVYPEGTHHTYGKRKGEEKVSSNAEVGFVHEFGGHGNAAREWMKAANEECADATAEAEWQAYDEWLNSIGL